MILNTQCLQVNDMSMKKIKYERPVIQKMNTGLMNKFGTRTEYEPVTHIESVSVKSLIKDFGSPLYVF